MVNEQTSQGSIVFTSEPFCTALQQMITRVSLKNIKSWCCSAAMWNYQEDPCVKKTTTELSKWVQWNSHECGEQGIHFKHACISFRGEKCTTMPWNLNGQTSMDPANEWSLLSVLLFICLIIHFFWFLLFFTHYAFLFQETRKKRKLTFRWFHHELPVFLFVHLMHLLNMWHVLIFVDKQYNLALSCRTS